MQFFHLFIHGRAVLSSALGSCPRRLTCPAPGAAGSLAVLPGQENLSCNFGFQRNMDSSFWCVL